MNRRCWVQYNQEIKEGPDRYIKIVRKGLGCQIPGVKKWRWGGEAARCKQDVKGGGGEKREKNKKRSIRS